MPGCKLFEIWTSTHHDSDGIYYMECKHSFVARFAANTVSDLERARYYAAAWADYCPNCDIVLGSDEDPEEDPEVGF